MPPSPLPDPLHIFRFPEVSGGFSALLTHLACAAALPRLATKRLSNSNAGSGDYSELEQNALLQWQHFRLEGDLMAAAMSPL